MGALVRSLQQGPNADPVATGYFALGASIVVLLCAVLGVGFGVLSLFGFGKVDGSSRPVMGAFGALAGALMCAFLVSSFVAGVRSRVGAQDPSDLVSEPWPFVDETTGLRFDRPGPEWILRTGDEAKSINPIAVGLAFDSSDARGHERVVVILSEDLTGSDVDRTNLLSVGRAMAENTAGASGTIEGVELLEVDGVPAVNYVVSDRIDGAPGRSFAVALFRDDRCVQILFAGEAHDPDLNANEFAGILADVSFDESR